MFDPAVSGVHIHPAAAIGAAACHSHHNAVAQWVHGSRERLDPTPLTLEATDDKAPDQQSLLRAYLRDVGSHQLLTRREEGALAKALKRHNDALHQNLWAIPFTGRFIVERWNQLRRAKRITAALAAQAPAQRSPHAGARIDQALSRVEALLQRRARLSQGPAQRFRAYARIDRQIQKLLRRADLSPTLLQEALQVLRERHATILKTGQRSLERYAGADLRREIGLSPAVFRSRMRKIEVHAQALLEARNRFVEHNLKLVVKIAKEFCGMGLPLIDLIQEGNLVLLHAVQKFDHRRGVRFSTYGSWWIRQACIRAIQNQARTVRLPANIHDRMLRLDKLEAKLSGHLKRAPEAHELSDALGISEQQLETLQLVRQKPIPLEAPLPNLDGRTIEDAIADPAHLSPVDVIDRARVARQIAEVFPDLSSRGQRVLRCRFGLDGEPPRTLAEIGRLLNLSRERVRQIESTAITELRRGLEDRRLLEASDWEASPSAG